MRIRPFAAGAPTAYLWTLAVSVLLIVSGSAIRHTIAALVVQTAYGPFYSLNRRIENIFSVYRENQHLLARVIELTAKNARLGEAARENAHLRGMLEFKTRSEFTVIPAEVVGSPSVPLGGTLWVSAQPGRVLTIGSPVVTPEGLVGSVSGYAGGLVEVRSLWDRDCRVAAIDRRSRVAGIVERVAGPHLRFSYVPADGDVAEGDTIVSSGWGERYPEGLPIGEVHTVAIDSASFFLAVIVKPFVRFETLEDVFVVQSAGGY